MTHHTAEKDARLKTYWRIEAAKKIAKMYRKGWVAAHVQWSTGSGDDRVLVLWERVTPPGSTADLRAAPADPTDGATT